MGVGDVISGLLQNIKTDKTLLVRVIVGGVLLLTSFILGFAFIVRLWVYQGRHHTMYALEALGYDDPNFTETFPQITFCPGARFNNQTQQVEFGVINRVYCNFHDIQPVDFHNPESTQKNEKVTDITNIKAHVKHTIDFREYDCYDVNFVEKDSPQIKWLDSHSYIACRVDVNSYVHVYVYGFAQKRPSHVLSHYTNIKNGEYTLLSVRAETASHYPSTFYEIDHKDEELRFDYGRHPDHLWVTFGFSRFSRRKYQAFHGTHTYTDVTIGMIGGFAFLFFMLYQVVAFVTRIFRPSGYESEPLVK